MEPKEQAGRKAAEYVKDGMVVGLGTGSTAVFVIVPFFMAVLSFIIRLRAMFELGFFIVTAVVVAVIPSVIN